MPSVQANGIEISYEIDGDGPPLLLVMGLGGQLTDWAPGLIDRLAEDFSVIRFDNRDSGLSTSINKPVPPQWQFVLATVSPRLVKAPYMLDDMADDAAALLTQLDIADAHVVGMSMGGMIAQLLAINHPARVRSLCSIMSNTGDRFSGRPTARVVYQIARGRSKEPTQETALDISMDFFRLVGGPHWDPVEHRRRGAISIARAFNPGGTVRQSMAITLATDRTARLGQITAPTVVMHGLADPLVRPSGGRATARALPHSRLIMFPEMGHDLSATRHEEMAMAIRENAHRVGS